MKTFALLASAAFAMFAVSAPASAALINCPASFTADGTAKVFNGGDTAASACQYDDATDNDDVASIANLNASAFFGFSDWEANDQTQLDPGNDLTDAWAIDDVDFAAYDYIMVFKDGNGTHLTAFLFNEEFSSGTWNTPFVDPPFDLPGGSVEHEVSHYTIARRLADDIDIPEPGMLGLLGLGLAGIGLSRRRRA